MDSHDFLSTTVPIIYHSWQVFKSTSCVHSELLQVCFFQDFFNTGRSILVQLPSSFFSIHFVSVSVVHPYSRTDTTTSWKKSCFILSDELHVHMIYNISIAVYDFARSILMSLSIDDTQQPRYVNLSNFWVEMSLFWLKQMYSVLSAFTCNQLHTPDCSRDSTYVSFFLWRCHLHSQRP